MDEFTTTLVSVLIEYGTQIVLLVLTGVLARVLSWVRMLVQNNITEGAVSDAVRYVEQIYLEASGNEKFSEALRIASAKLNKCHIKIDEDELKMLIESAVNKFYPKDNSKTDPE